MVIMDAVRTDEILKKSNIFSPSEVTNEFHAILPANSDF